MVKPAKSAKSAKTDRQKVIDQLKKQQKRSEQRRGLMIVAVSVVVALLIIGAAAYKPVKDWWDLRKFNDIQVSEIGAPATACQKVETKPADGQQDHVPAGTPLNYTDAPPAFGQHLDSPDPMERKFYSPADRPEVGTLVHNLEHGYTILWYDQTAAEDADMLKDLRAIASKYEGTDNFRLKLKVAPWTTEDGADFPEGQRIAFTHWSKGGADADLESAKQQGVWQYCSEPSGEALQQFMTDYPYMDSPEPDAM